MGWIPYSGVPAGHFGSQQPVPQAIQNRLAGAQQAQQQFASIGPHSSGAVTGLQGIGSYLAGRQEADANQQAASYLPASSSQPSPSFLANGLGGGSGALDPSTLSAGAQTGLDNFRQMVARKSDRRLKSDVVRVGRLPNGLAVYRYRLEGGAPELGLMAQEVALVRPWAVWEAEDGFLRVDYSKAVL